MDWKQVLRKLEHSKYWDEAIEFMQDVIAKDPNNMDAYIAMNYLLMNLLVEENHDETKHDYYEILAKKYFDESYAKFSDNPEYLYFTGKTAGMSEWFFGLEAEDVEAMLKKASVLEPDNLVYKRGSYSCLSICDPKNVELINSCIKKILEKPELLDFIRSKGAVGEYLLEVHFEIRNY